MKEKMKVKGGYAAEACRLTGYSRTVFERAKKKQSSGETLTKAELEVFVKYTELVKEAEKKQQSLKAEVNHGI